MNLEIERKFSVKAESIEKLQKKSCIKITQGYLTLASGYHTRIRITEKRGKEEAFIASKVGSGLVREEFEQKIDLAHAKLLMSKCLKVLKKERRKIKHQGHTWDVDFFPDHNLWVAEVELKSETEPFALPDFTLAEVTGNNAYSNIVLAKNQD